MYQNKRFLALIPARSGSKGLKDKNIKHLCGKPLIAYTIEEAVESNLFEDVLVSTDSPDYGRIAESYGAYVPSLRPDSLSTDSATSIDLMLYTLDFLEKQGKTYDYVALLQPTSPLRTKKHIQEGVELLLEHQVDSVVGVCACEHPVEWTMKESQLSDLSFFYEEKYRKNRQQIETSYRLNGALFLSSVSMLQETASFYGGSSRAYVMEQQVSVDIDSLEDFMWAEYMLSTRK